MSTRIISEVASIFFLFHSWNLLIGTNSRLRGNFYPGCCLYLPETVAICPGMASLLARQATAILLLHLTLPLIFNNAISLLTEKKDHIAYPVWSFDIKQIKIIFVIMIWKWLLLNSSALCLSYVLCIYPRINEFMITYDDDHILLVVELYSGCIIVFKMSNTWTRFWCRRFQFCKPIRASIWLAL